MPETFEDEALVLKTAASGEADRRVFFLGRARGIFTALAKGARKSKKRFMGKLEPFQRGVAACSRYGATDYLDEFRVLGRTDRIPGDLARYTLACYACELVLGQLPTGAPAPEVYALLAELFGVLQEAAPPPVRLLRLAFEARYLAALGFFPALEPCAACGGELPAAMTFDPRASEWRCGRACTPGRAPSPLSAFPVSRGAWALVEGLRSLPLSALARLAPSPGQLKELAALADGLIGAHVPGVVRSRALLDAELARDD